MSRSCTSDFKHGFVFDPRHGYALDELLKLEAPEEVEGFSAFWTELFNQALQIETRPQLVELDVKNGLRIHALQYTSLHGVVIQGWATTPVDGPIQCGVVHTHGYGGREAPDERLPVENAVVFYPGLRGLPPTLLDGIPSGSGEHVLHGIHSKDDYVIGHCVADVWCCASALLELYPGAADKLYYMGGSFGGGIGALALAWDKRFKKAQLVVPTFGNHPLRLELESCGSGEPVRRRHWKTPEIGNTLAYFDAAVAARRIDIPVIFACALFDPAVPPAGQFSVYNATPEPKELAILSAGHFEYEGQEEEGERFFEQQVAFFAKPF